MAEQDTHNQRETKLFRQEALERLSSPEQLDQLVEVVSPKAWLPLSALGFLVLTAGIWSIFGRLPLNVSGQGVLVRPRDVVQFQSPSSGSLMVWQVQPGDTVEAGQVLGTIDQSQVQQQLQQEQDKLADLLAQTGETAEVKRQQIQLKREILEQRRGILESSLREYQALAPILREKGVLALQENREGLQLRLSQARELIPRLEERVASRQLLFDQGAMSADSVLQGQQELFDSLARVADLEAQLMQLDSQAAQNQLQYLQNESQIRETRTQLQDLATQEAQLLEEELQLGFDRENQLQEVRRRIAQLELQLTTNGQVLSPYDGQVLEIAAAPGQVVSQGTMLGTLQAEDEAEALVSLAFFADKDGKQIKPGMAAQVTPSIVKRERHGGIEGEVVEVSPFPVTSQSVASIVGNPDFANQLVRDSAPMQITIQLAADPDTFSGYRWTSSTGPQEDISSGTSAAVQVRVGEIAPIAYVIPLFRSWTGIY